MEAEGMDPAEVLNLLGHDLRGPLFTARGYVQLLAGRLEDPELTGLANTASECIDEASRMVEGVLAWARTEPHRLETTEVNLQEVMEEAIKYGHLDGRKITLEGLPTVHADRRALRYALQHLIDNGLRHGEAPVVVRGGKEGRRWWLEVVDHGEGIPDDEHDRYFVPFWQTQQKSSGIGLALAHKVATRYGGTCTFRRDGDTTVVRLEGNDE